MNLKRTLPVQAFVFVVLLGFLSIGQIARWDLLDQIAMSDRYELFGSFYPSPSESIPSGVSVYFPGGALIGVVLKKFVPSSYVTHFMLFIAVCVVLFFYQVQKRIVHNIDSQANTAGFQPLAIIFSLFVARNWLIYAVEFKPDTIAFLLGSLGIIVAKADNEDDIAPLSYLLGSLLTGFALVFKQQYVAFLGGMIFYALICKNRRFQFFTVLASLWALIVLIAIYQHKSSLFWTVTVLSDDGFVTLRQWANDHAYLALALVVVQSGILYQAYLNNCHKGENVFSTITRRQLLRSPWPTILFVSALGAWASAWKVGGNAGNTAMGLILLLPLVYLVLRNLEQRIVILIAWAVLLGQIGSVYSAIKKYEESANLTRAVKSLPIRTNARVLTGSDVYGASRMINSSLPIGNYWARSVRSGSDITNELGKVLEEENFDYLVVENWPKNRQYIVNSNKYSTVFENELGIVAVRK